MNRRFMQCISLSRVCLHIIRALSKPLTPVSLAFHKIQHCISIGWMPVSGTAALWPTAICRVTSRSGHAKRPPGASASIDTRTCTCLYLCFCGRWRARFLSLHTRVLPLITMSFVAKVATIKEKGRVSFFSFHVFVPESLLPLQLPLVVSLCFGFRCPQRTVRCVLYVFVLTIILLYYSCWRQRQDFFFFFSF